MKALPQTPANAALVRARRLLHAHQDRARKDGVALDYGVAQLRELLASTPLCEYCRNPVAWNVSLDHRTPTGRGGKHNLDNLAVCCPRCNSLKGMLTEDEFRELLKLLALLHPAARADVERRLIAGGGRYAGNRHGRRLLLEGAARGRTSGTEKQTARRHFPPEVGNDAVAIIWRPG
jgi:5-methylcytosine-specific restriction endonuclease McrA